MKKLYALALTLLIGFAFLAQDASAQVVCTQEILQCPDGSIVSRDPDNNCKFPECPACINPETGQPDELVVCVLDPCEIATCDAAPDALCTPNFCGGCFAIYTDESNEVIDCDDICQLPIEVGPCRAAIPRWAYDADAGECVQFIYGGCQGNANNFPTQQDCEATCDVPDKPPHVPDVPAVSGWSKLMMIGVFLTGLISLSYFSWPLRRRS
jgi:hypothetical protein